MLTSKASLRLTLLASAIFLVACQPKSDPKESKDQQKPAVVEQKPVELTLKGKQFKVRWFCQTVVVKLALNLL